MTGIPQLFRCPISLDLFTDPVTLCTGQTYDRPSIERWLAGGNLTCPVTMQRLRDPTLVPNHTLRHLIHQWLLTGDPPGGAEEESRPQDPARGLSLAALKLDLQCSGGGGAGRLETLRRIRALLLESDVGQSCLIQLGFFSPLLRLLFQSRPPCPPELAEVALDCVLSMSPAAHAAALDMLKEASSLASLVRLLERGSAKARTGLCYLLEAIAASPRSEELSLVVGQTPGVLRALVALLNDRPRGGTADAAARAIAGLCSLEANREGAVAAGAVDALVAYLPDAAPRNAARAVATLEVMAGLESGGGALVRNPAAVAALVRMVFRVSASDHRAGEHAVGALLSVCGSSGRARVDAVNAGALTQLLLLLQSQCSSKAKEKTRALLKLLSSMWA